MNKKHNLRNHSKMRAFQRYGKDLDKRKRKEIINLIQINKSVKFLKKRSLRVTEWEVQFEGELFRVLYDKNRKEIITFLPPRK